MTTGTERGRDAVVEEYSRRLEGRRARLAECERRHVWLSRARLAIAIGAGVYAYVAGLAGAAWLALPVGAFLVTAVVHARVLAAKARAGSAIAFYERGLERLTHTWMGRGRTGETWKPADHLYTDDLDVFGRGSLFELLSTARTQAGESCLARWLLTPADPGEITARQIGLGELAPQHDLRESLAVAGDGVREEVDTATLRRWCAGPPELGGAFARTTLLFMTATTAVLGLWWMLAAQPPRLVPQATVVLVAIQSLVALALRARVRRAIGGVELASQDLDLVAGLLALIETRTFESPRLLALQQRVLSTAAPASTEIARLAQLVALLRSRQNALFALPAALVLWTTQVAHAIDYWRRRVGPAVPGWLEAIGEFEALAALSGFTAERPDHTFPLVEDAAAARLDARDLAHPLLGPEAVANDVALGADAKHLLIVSGSNMSGKSTLLRALGLNLVLASAGAPVRARRFRCAAVSLGASIRVQDSLLDGRSRFYAEITRLKQIVDLARATNGALIFLLDEILAGTNSHDRRLGAEAVLRGLVQSGAVGLATTHDLALGDLVASRDLKAANVHFEDQIVDGALSFDYRLKPGLVRTGNAIPLMRSIGLDV